MHVRSFKTRWFARFARRHGIPDGDLLDAVRRAERGLIDANLGGGVIKQRISRENEGRSGGYRSIVLFKAGDRAILAYGFAKNARDNIDADELRALRDLAREMLAYHPAQISVAIERSALTELRDDDDEDLSQ